MCSPGRKSHNLIGGRRAVTDNLGMDALVLYHDGRSSGRYSLGS